MAAGAPSELQRFAAGLKDDLAAVRAALSLPSSNGQIEGQVNHLKVPKSMANHAREPLLLVYNLEIMPVLVLGADLLL